MEIKLFTQKEFSIFFPSLKLGDKYPEDLMFELSTMFFESINADTNQKTLQFFNNLNPIQLLLYFFSDFVYFTDGLTKEQIIAKKDDENFLSVLMSTSLDKYLTIEKIDLNEPLFASKFSPSISTLRTYLYFMSKILNNRPKNDPKNTIILDVLNKAINISRCCLDLLQDGFESEAFSTWRTLHETECILIVLVTYGPNMIASYLEHMRYSLAYKKMLPTKEETDETFVKIKKELAEMGLKSKDLKKYIEYGYLTSIPNIKLDIDYKLNFRDGVEKYAGLARYSDLYEYSSEIAHSSPLMIYSNPKSLFHLTLVLLYEVFFRIENVFSTIYVNVVSEQQRHDYLAMKKLYGSTLKLIYNRELQLYNFLKQNKKI